MWAGGTSYQPTSGLRVVGDASARDVPNAEKCWGATTFVAAEHFSPFVIPHGANVTASSPDGAHGHDRDDAAKFDHLLPLTDLAAPSSVHER